MPSRHCTASLSLSLAIAVGVASPGTAQDATATLWTAEDAQSFCDALPLVDEASIDAMAGSYAAALEEMAPAVLLNLRRLDAVEADTLLQKAAAINWGILNLLTDVHYLESGPCALMMSAETLQQVDAAWNLHGLWMIDAPLDDGSLPMSYIVFGAGKVVIAYPRAAVIEVADYDFSGGRYAYTPFIVADIANTAELRALTNIQVLERPQATPGAFRGPRGSAIRTMSLDGDLIRVSYSVLGIGADKTVDNLKIERR